MQIVNIFNDLTIPRYFFSINLNLKLIKPDLHNYIFDNLQKENNILRWDLQNALKTNSNEEYI
jgi:hypothetical protein